MSSYQKFLDEKFSDVSKEAARLIDRASKELEAAVTDATEDLAEFREHSPVVFEGSGNTNIPRMRWEATQKELLTVQLLLKDARSRISVIEPQLLRLKQSGKLSHARLITLIDKNNAERLSSLSMISRTEAQTKDFLSKQFERQQLAQAETEKLLRLTSQLESMKVELGPKHPEVLKLTQEINHVKAYVEKLSDELKVTDEEPVTTPEELMDAYVDLLRNDVMIRCSRSGQLMLGLICPIGRPMSPGIRLSTRSAIGVKRRIRRSPDTITIAIRTPLSRLTRSLLIRASSSLRPCNSSLTVLSSSLVL